ncbi:MAG TPA: tetratricopeptide repeat protein, partial [Rhizomicrobium sp.]|nr:tetratricopeptide repeat protein [Rhizomicrobium sp.]
MAQALPQPTMDALAGVDARLEAIDRLESLVNEVAREKARHRSNIALKRGIQSWRRGDIVKAGQWALRATEADENNAKAFHVLAMALERMGHVHKALITYERAFELDPEDPELLINLGLTAWNLKLTEGAAKMFQLYIAACPDSPLGYNNLGGALGDMGRPDVAIEVLRDAIRKMPDQAILWNSLATVLAEEGRAEESIVFYNEAARLEPDFARVYHNLGYAYQHLSQRDKGLVAYDRALELVV